MLTIDMLNIFVVRFFFFNYYFALTRSLAFWEDFTCLDISQCMLNKTILSVAAKYVDSDVSECLVQFLALGTKVEFHFS